MCPDYALQALARHFEFAESSVVAVGPPKPLEESVADSGSPAWSALVVDRADADAMSHRMQLQVKVVYYSV